MKAWLIQIDAWNGAVAVPVRMASHDDERLCNLDGQTWWPVIEKLPTLRYDFFDGSFDAASITSPSGSFDVAIEAIPALPALAIHDARIRIWGGELGDAFATFTLTFDGRVKEQPTMSDGSISISIGADDSWLDQPLLKTYAGTGAAEGGTDLEGQVKPLALGAPRFAPATLIDAVDNIYQLSGYGPLQLVETAFERLNRFGAVAGNAGNFAGLKAGEVKRGEWATCLAQGFVRFGAPPEGMLSFHVRGDAQGSWSRLPGDLCRRVAELAGGVAKVAAADVAALNVARPWPLSIMVTAQTTARDLIQRIAMSVNAVAYIDWLGMLRLAALGIGAASLTIAADGSALPPVAEVRQVEASAPYWKIAQGAAVTWQVHGLNDIAFSAPLNPRGPYDPAETYREGDMVTLPNGSQWLFVANTPATGSAPADDNPKWFRLSDAITAANVTYGDGKTVEELKPAEPGATHGAPGSAPFGDGSADQAMNALKALALTADASEIVAGAHALIDRTRKGNLAALEQQLLGQERKSRWERLLHLDGTELATRVRQEINERVDGDAAIVKMVNSIEATATDGIAAALAAIEQEATVRASADAAETFARDLAISLFRAEVDGEIVDVMAAVASETETRAAADSAEAAARLALAASIDGRLGQIDAAILSEQITRVNADNALASDVTSLGAAFGGMEAAISIVAAAQASADSAIALLSTTLDAKTSARWEVETVSGDNRARLRIFADANQGAGVAIVGDVEIDGSLLVTKSVSADQLVADGVTRTRTLLNASVATLSPSMVDIVTIAVDMDRPGTIIVLASYQFTFTSATWSAAISVNGVELQTGSGSVDHYASFVGSFDVTTPGTYTARARASGAGASINSGGCSLIVIRTYA